MTIDTKELRRLAQAATPGPWKILPLGDEVKCFAVADINFLSVLTVVDEGDTSFGAVYLDGDAKFIAAANPAAIDELLDRLEVAEKDIALKEKIIDALGSKLSDIANERYALRIKIAEMEKQEPVYLFRRKGWEEFCTCSKERYEEFYTNPRVFEVKKLYLAPGAQPAPNVPDKVEVREDKEGEIFSRGSYNEGYDDGWNDCMDAMLAAAPEAKS